MSNSERWTRHAPWACSALLAACAQAPASDMASALAPKSAIACITKAEPATAKDASDGAAFRSGVEAGPLFAVSSPAGLAACEITYEPGIVALEYRFRDGAVLRASHDAAIESTEQDLSLALQLAADPLSVLQPAERAAFGAKGCGIDWLHPETQASPRVPAGQELVFRGETCNCQARLLKNATGRVIGLRLTSAC